MTQYMKRGLTIGQAAAFAGVTIKTIRHYHRLGIVPEPSRDCSGYRRYNSSDLLQLVKVRTLAEAGVPLVEITALLEASSEDFIDAIHDVQDKLTKKIADLQMRQASLERLAQGKHILLPERACAILNHLINLGFSPDYVEAQEEGLVLFKALLPEQFDDFLQRLEGRLNDPVYVDLSKRSWEAAFWEIDDPRLDELATALAKNLLSNHITSANLNQQNQFDGLRYGMVNDHLGEQMPTIIRLTTMIETKLRQAGLNIPRSHADPST